MKEQLKSGIKEFDELIEQFENGELNFVDFTCKLWNGGLYAGIDQVNGDDTSDDKCTLHIVSQQSELLIGFAENLRKNGELPEMLNIEKKVANYIANL